MSAQEDQALLMLQRANLSLRKAILANFPCAYEHFLPAPTGITADQRNAIYCNEAMLADTMMPLDKVILGPTGKSVTRSYFTSLDMLVPRKTDIGTFDLNGGASQDANSQEYKYTLAMEYLRKAAPASAQKTNNDVKGSKDTLVKRGVPATTVDLYVEKQLNWSTARAKWDAARNEAIEARESRPDKQSAAAFSLRQKKLKSAQGELHARWMDWVVNGDKLKVDYCFALVDRDSIMARIERAKEATRDAMLTSIDGTEWAQVHFEPANWAKLCRDKAVAWRTRHPASPAHVQMQLDSLRSMKEAYNAYDAQLAQRAASGQPGGTAPTEFDINTAKFPDTNVPDITSKKEEIESKAPALQAAFKDWEAAKAEPTPDAEKVRRLQWKVAALENQETMRVVKEYNKPSVSENKLQAAEKRLREAYNAMYTAEKKARSIPIIPGADKELVEKKDEWLKARTALTEAQTDETTAQLSASGAANLRTSIKSRITSLNSEIQRLEGRLAGNNPPDMIVGVEGDKEGPIEKSKPDTSGGAVGSGRGDSGTADVWTDIAFTVSAQSDDHKLEEHGMSGAFHAEAQTWYAAVKAESSFSKNDKTINDFMSKCTISGSFSAMVVSIKRPWLHAELFQDFDIDIPAGTFLSPGAKTIKYWVENGDNEYNGYVRTNYGKFPAYPTAFIVAADANLSFKSTQSAAEEALKVLQTDSSLEASFGSWNISGGAGAKIKTNDKSASQHMEVKDGALQISFQAPQIIGWVSEVLPELPRGDIPKAGGLHGAPVRGYRANM
ncbi:hypothetical protein M441DRAFT_30603 [Trichoderma asperellum CBS 433.97]|uniref:Uncharacterized protein n=1 Tax=Trichoderma asperellum (strain ATCC 204424 / CBS 433.97 / NBRC 101777) TaxID=1042311 RepID=A0A2T3YY25_TRIA4|nr:hypothetical protein M441DRAFT_30603 [Trichoderma asperellum CBS 433.97]PTB37465.1 hypothetical protein M441DRAFT_30603 [Trichoderma asperellum CBS 433.97]